MTAPSWMLVRLALDTRAHHAGADERRLAWMDSASLDDYRRFMCGVYGFEWAVEARLRSIEGFDRLLPDRWRGHHLQQDLVELGMSRLAIERLPVCVLPPLASLSQGLGWMFVLERHTLVSGLLCRQLARSLGGEHRIPVAYFMATSATPGRRLRQLGEALAEHAKHDHKAPATIVRAANDGFRCQRQWYLAQQSSVAPSLEANPSAVA